MRYKNIVLIDDDVEDQEIFKTALNFLSEDISCTAFTNAKEALAQVVEGKIIADIIFLDLNMPSMSGQEFLADFKAKNVFKQIPIIIFSTSSQRSTIEAAKEMGATDFITKPDRFDKLVDLLKPILN
jgi:CheY-like chemotaxis protein